jgi:hypothetical protein
MQTTCIDNTRRPQVSGLRDRETVVPAVLLCTSSSSFILLLTIVYQFLCQQNLPP